MPVHVGASGVVVDRRFVEYLCSCSGDAALVSVCRSFKSAYRTLHGYRYLFWISFLEHPLWYWYTLNVCSEHMF